MSFEIQSDVPMPGRRNRYPFASMVSGQSFEVHGEAEARKVRNASYQYAKKVNEDSAKQVAEGKLTQEQAVAAEVKFALRQVSKAPQLDTNGQPVLDAEGKPVEIKIFRLWRE